MHGQQNSKIPLYVFDRIILYKERTETRRLVCLAESL